jgi:hypothetical protein
MNVKELVNRFEKSARPKERKDLSCQISRHFVNKLESLASHWPEANITKLVALSKSLHANPNYLDLMLADEMISLLQKGELRIAIESCSIKGKMNIFGSSGGLCRGDA